MRALFQNMPWSLGWFAFTGVLFLLQLFPFTGIFLMMVAAPFWSVVTVNIGFVSLAAEVLAGRVAAAWFAAPLIWFGGYAGAAYVSHQRAADLDAQIRARNAGQQVAFAADREALVFTGRSSDLSSAPSHFVREYRVPVAYELNASRRERSYRATRVMADPVCEAVKSDASYRAANIHITWFHHGGGAVRTRRELVRGLCMISSPEEPNLPALLVEAKQEKHAEALVPHTLTRISIAAPGGSAVELVSGRGEVLSWFPKPYMGCFLNSGAARWQCDAGFWRISVPLGSDSAYGGSLDVIARSLGLQRAFAADRRDEIAAVQLPVLTSIVRTNEERAIATLDEVIANPAKRITVHDVRGLAEQPELVKGRHDKIVHAIAGALANKQAGYETARVLQDILVALPASAFDAIGPSLLAVFEAQSRLDDDAVSQPMASRLGRFGTQAVPTLERLVFSNQRRAFLAAVYGLCRVGPDAAPLAEKLAALSVKSQGRHRDLDMAVYATLMRMGREDIVEREKTANERFTKLGTIVLGRAITPASPPSVCVDSRGWPRVPD
jgi:hypothetical protein